MFIVEKPLLNQKVSKCKEHEGQRLYMYLTQSSSDVALFFLNVTYTVRVVARIPTQQESRPTTKV